LVSISTWKLPEAKFLQNAIRLLRSACEYCAGCWRPTAFFALAVIVSVSDAGAGRLRIAHQWAPELDARDRAARVFVAEVERRLPQTKISIHPQSSLGIKPLEQYQALLDGRIEMAIFPLFYIAPQIPELSITLLPAVPATTDQAQLLKGSVFQRRFQEFCESKGIHILTWWWLAGGIVSRSAEIGGPGSYKGLTVRSGDPNFDLMFQALGATPKIMPSTEIGPSLRSGGLDAALASFESFVSLHIYEHTKYAILGGNTLYVSLHPLMISAKIWNALSDEEKKAFEEAAEIANTHFQASQREAELQAVATFKEAGARVRPMTFEEYQSWLHVANATSWRAYRESSETARILFDSMLQSFVSNPQNAKTAPPSREFRISHQWPAEIDARDRAARIFAQEVEARVPGISFKIFPQLSLNMRAEEQFDALQSGRLEMSVYVLAYAVKKVPEFSLAYLPGLYPSVEIVRTLKGSKILDQVQAVANANGVHILAWWWVPGGFVTHNREIAGPDTVQGLRLRGGDRMFDLMLKKAGATPVDLPSNEIYAAMQSGKLDGALTSYETFVSTKIYEHAKFFTAGSPGIWMFLNALVISQSVWEELAEPDKRAFELAAEISEGYFDETQRDAEKRFIDTFSRAGAKHHVFTYENYLAWLQLAQETAWKEYIAISPTAETMLTESVATILDRAKGRP
jgi:TRAP-type C4-dicarboxylate transport system substrate-binding protein